MKPTRTILAILLALCPAAVCAQSIRMDKPSVADYLPLLDARGYMAYGFSCKGLRGKEATFELREFIEGKEAADSPRMLIPYRLPIKGKKLVIGFIPSDNDSTARCIISSEGSFTVGSDLPLRQIYWESRGEHVYRYLSKPFELPRRAGKEASFIPLVLYCSFWYDKKHKVVRCCGEKVIKPDLSSEILTHCPHYYVIGMKIL